MATPKNASREKDKYGDRRRHAELRRAQAEVEESRTKYVNLYDFSPVGYMTLNKRGVIVDLNLTAAELLGRPRKTLMNVTFSQFVTPEYRNQFLEHKRRVFETGEKQSSELMLEKADGTSFWVVMESIGQRNLEGNFSRLQCALTDITARKLEEQEARWSYAYRKAIDDSLLIGVAAWDLEGRQTHANQAFCKLVGWGLDELVALEPPYPYWPSGDEGESQQVFGNPGDPHLDGRSYEFRLRRKNGERFDALVYLSALKDPEGKPIGWVGSFGDITEHKRRDGEIRRLNAELEDRARRRTEQLEKANRILRKEFVERKRSEEALRQLTLTLEERVRDRTARLAEAIASLEAEVGRRRETEEALRRERERLQAIIDHIPVMLCLYKPSGGVYLVNREFERVLGWSLEDLKKLDILTEALPDSADRQEVLNFVAGSISAWRDFRVRRRNGQLIDSTWANVKLSSGEQVSIGIDTSELRAAERDRLRLAAAVEQAGEGIAIISPDGLINSVNPAFEELTGRTRGELVGTNYTEVLAGDAEDSEVKKNLEDVFHCAKSLTTHVTRKTKAGDMLELDISCAPILDQSGTVINYLAVERDVTQQYRLDQLIRQGQKLEALGTLAGGIAHDFNNVLMPIVLNTEMALLDLPAESALRSYLELALAAAFRGKDLIKQIITFSRQKEQARRPLKAVPLIKEALRFLESSLPQTIEVSRSIQENLEDTILGDPSQVHQIVMNLCTNAVQAMRDKGGVLEVSLGEENVDSARAVSIPDLKPGLYLKLTVRDTGPGMTGDVLERIFDPFFTTKQPGEGLGMGLAVVRGIARSMGGAAIASSEAGQGSTFTVYLPRVKASPQSEELEAEKLAAGRGSILVVDDEKVQLESYVRVLTRLGYSVKGETDPAEALVRFREDPTAFDLVITDQTMPKIGGLRLAEEVLRLRPEIPIVLCTGYSETVDAEQARAAGIREFMMKPFSVREISATVRRALARP